MTGERARQQLRSHENGVLKAIFTHLHLAGPCEAMTRAKGSQKTSIKLGARLDKGVRAERGPKAKGSTSRRTITPTDTTYCMQNKMGASQRHVAIVRLHQLT